MKRLAVQGLFVLLFVSPELCAEAVAPWVGASGLSELEQRRLEHTRRSRCVPRRSEVRWPPYPGAVLLSVDWGRMAPRCESRDGWDDLGGLSLLSRDELDVVSEYYAGVLEDHQRYEDGERVMFVAARIDQFLWERDYYKHANIAVLKAPPKWAATGYRVLIEFNRPAPP